MLYYSHEVRNTRKGMEMENKCHCNSCYVCYYNYYESFKKQIDECRAARIVTNREMEMKRYQVNLNRVTAEATNALIALDDTFVGTKNYMGITYFWNHEYRHLFRDNRRHWIKIHTAFMKNNLLVDGQSDKHLEIIKKYIKE